MSRVVENDGRSFFRRVVRRVEVGAAAAVLGGSLISCGAGEIPGKKQEIIPVVIGDGFIYNGVNLRTDPQRIEDSADGSSNKCFTTGDAITFDSQKALLAPDADQNGDWVGFDTRSLSEQGKKNIGDCSSHKTVWVARTNVAGDIKKTSSNQG